MRSPRRWLRRTLEARRIRPRARQLQALLRREFNEQVELQAGIPKGGADAIYFAVADGRRLGVLRLNNPHKRRIDPRPGTLPRQPLAPEARLDYEWDIYSRLSALELSPQPVWRTGDATLCSYVAFRRAALTLIDDRSRFWPLLESIVPAVRRMHDADVTHLDLNLGNVLVSDDEREIRFIDFEYAPADWIAPAQQRAYDYLRLVNNSLKRRRGLAALRAAPERMRAMLENSVDPAARQADLHFVPRLCPRLMHEPAVCGVLEDFFPGMAAA